MHRVVGAVGKECPRLPVYRGLDLVLIKEGRIFELRPYLVECLHPAEVYLDPLVMSILAVPIASGRFPQGSVIIIDGIFRLKPLVIIAGGYDLGAEGQVLVLGILKDADILGMMCRKDRDDIAVGIEFQFVDAYLTVEPVNGLRIVVAVIDDVIMSLMLQDRVMTRSVNRLVFIRCQHLSFILERSHRSRCRCGILNAIGICMTGAGGIGEIIDTIPFKYKGCLEDILQFCVGNQSLLAEELIGCDREGGLLVPSAGIYCPVFGKCIHVKLAFAQLRYAATEAFVNAPCREVEILAAVIIGKQLRVEGDDIVYITVGHHHCIVVA